MAIVAALFGGFTIFILTAWTLVINPSTNQYLQLLSNYFIGYSVTWWGSIVGFLYGSLIGAVIGWAGSIIYGTLESKIPSPNVHVRHTAKAAVDPHGLEQGHRRELRRAA